MALVSSILFSIMASILATAAARHMLSLSQPLEDGGERRSGGAQTFVIVLPIFVGNSNNRIGWVKEVHHHHYSLFGRARSGF